MPTNPNKLSQFWQELKRRKVIKVIAMYAATAFIILEVADIVMPGLGLPDWTVTFIIILLIIGFPITIILSWIFDITPEGMKKTESVELINQRETVTVPTKRKLKVSDVIIAGLFTIVVILAYPKAFKKDRLGQLKGADGKISLAVIPFQNMTNDTLWNIWEMGIQNQLINNLSNTTGLLVRQLDRVSGVLQSSGDFQHAALTPSMASSMSQKLNASVFVFGSIIKAGECVRLNVQLTDAQTDEIIQSFQLDSETEAELLDVVDSLSTMISNFLEISNIDPGVTGRKYFSSTSRSPQAVRYWAHGWSAYRNGDFRTAIEWYLKSLEIDSSNYSALWTISATYYNLGMYEEGKKWCMKMQDLKEHMPLSINQELMANWIYSVYYETPYEQVRWMKQLIELDDQDPGAYFLLGYIYLGLNQYHNAIPALEKALELYGSWDVKPLFAPNYLNLGIAYHHLGQYKKEKQIYKKALMDFPDDLGILHRQAILALSEGDTVADEGFIHDYVIKCRDVWGLSDSRIHSAVGDVFSSADYFVRAEKEYRQALALAPEDASILHNLARMLIDHDIDLNEGLKLVNQALEFSPDNWSYLDTRGWGLYKQGKLNEALKILQQARDLQPIYHHDIYLHMQEVEQALASKNK